MKREVPGRARHGCRQNYLCARGGGGVCTYWGCVTPNTPPTSGLACALQPLQSFQDSGVTLLPWQPNKAKDALACLGETNDVLGSRKRQTDTIMIVKCKICYFSFSEKYA